MPFSRPTLQTLQTQAAQDVAAGLPGSDPLLRFSNLGIMANVQAGLAYLMYGYLDWIAQQAVPITATGEFLEAWAAIKAKYRLAATNASGSVTFTGTNGVSIPSGTTLVRGDGQTYVTTASATIASGSATVPATGVPDPAGLVGAVQNTPLGSLMNLGTSIAGVNSSGIVSAAFTGGSDLESDTALRARMLLAYQNPSHGGDLADYESWAFDVAGVTRVWVLPSGFGPGTVVVYPMLDVAEAGNAGFPVGTNGVATGETRATAATGDQLAIANHILTLQPVTALVYVVAPVANVINITISGISSASSATQAAVTSALAQVIAAQATALGSTITLLSLSGAIASVPGTSGATLVAPASSVISPVGSLPTIGTVTFT